LLSSSASSRCVNLRRWSHFSPRPPVEPFQPRARPRHAPAAELAWAAGPAPERDGAHDLRLVHAACRVDPFERAVHRLARTRPTATASATGALQGVSAAGARARGEQEPHLEHPVHLHLRNLRRPAPLSAPPRPAPRAPRPAPRAPRPAPRAPRLARVGCTSIPSLSSVSSFCSWSDSSLPAQWEPLQPRGMLSAATFPDAPCGREGTREHARPSCPRRRTWEGRAGGTAHRSG